MGQRATQRVAPPADWSPRAKLSLSTVALLCLAGFVGPDLTAQNPPPTPVRYTEARAYKLRRTILLPGTVEARTSSVLASEVEGLVVELRAREGNRVKEGQVLARLRTTHLELELQGAQASHKEATARLKLAEKNMERARELHQSKIFSQQQLDDQLYEYNAWQGRCDQLEAQIARIEHDIERATIRAPFAGVVVREHTEVGEWVSEGGSVVELLALDELEIRVEVPERYFRNLRIGARARVTFEALPGRAVSGRVLSVIPQADARARTFPAKVRVRNPRRRIGVGMLAQVSFPVGGNYTATLVPKDAVVTRGERKFIYLLNGDSTVSEVAVETGTGLGSWIAINSGVVKPGQRVITRGNERLFPGQVVRGQPLAYELP
ncbi:MAG: efflux RND transporter periplasmic adaptor subunit [Terriglobia bacterium]